MIICLIQVVAFHFFSNAEVRGEIKGASATHYLVDFSKDAKAKGYEGDYSSKIVAKDNCVKVSGAGL